MSGEYVEVNGFRTFAEGRQSWADQNDFAGVDGREANALYAAARGLPPFNGDRVRLAVSQGVYERARTTLAANEKIVVFGRLATVAAAEPSHDTRHPYTLELHWLEPPISGSQITSAAASTVA